MSRHFRFQSTNNRLNSWHGSLSHHGCHCCRISCQLCHLKQDDWWGLHLTCVFPLPCAPGSMGRKPCGQGPPQMRPDGAGQLSGKVIDVQDEEDDDEEDDESSSDRWVSGSGSPGSFCLASWVPLGLWRLWFLCRALHGDPRAAAVFPGLSLILKSSQFRLWSPTKAFIGVPFGGQQLRH
jgi:hypothetical protein